MSLNNVLRPWDASRLPCHQAEWHPRHEDAEIGPPVSHECFSQLGRPTLVRCRLRAEKDRSREQLQVFTLGIPITDRSRQLTDNKLDRILLSLTLWFANLGATMNE